MTEGSELRERLLDSATALIEKQGELSFSLRQLAQAAGTSTMSIYTHFGNREGLCRALATRAFDEFTKEVKLAIDALEQASVDVQLRHMADAYRRMAFDHPTAFDLIFGGVVSFEDVSPISEQFSGLPTPSVSGYDAYGLFLDVFERGARENLLRSDMTSIQHMDCFWAQLHGLVTLERLGYVRSEKDANDRFAFGIDVVLAGLRSDVSDG